MTIIDANPFDSIRPYADNEVPEVIARLLQSDDFIYGIIHTQFPHASRYLQKPLVRYLRLRIARQLKEVTTIAEFQQHMMQFVARTIQRSMTAFTYAGMHHISTDKPSVFISNHRDITLDSALLNFALLQGNKATAEIAIGDNLLGNPLVSDLLRLNKSFVVQRSVSGFKAKLVALTELSRYIFQANQEGRSIWIAQQEGRAKNGADRTDPAIIKMLQLWPKKLGLSLNEVVEQLNILPVSISYEYDPCDGLKASELMARQSSSYVKGGKEDFDSILMGITLPKGRVHIEIGAPLQGDFANAKAVAESLDQQIISNYKIFPTSWFAVEQLLLLLQFGKTVSTLQEDAKQKLQVLLQQAKTALAVIDANELALQGKAFSSRLAAYPEQLQRHIIEMYANPLLSKYHISL